MILIACAPQAHGSSNPSTPLAATLHDTQRSSQETARAPTPPCKGEMAVPLQAEPPWDASAKADAKKRRAKAEAKLRRMCEPKAVSGKMEVDENISQQWADLTGGRDRLIQMMVDAENDKACWGLMYLCCSMNVSLWNLAWRTPSTGRLTSTRRRKSSRNS